MLSFLGKRLAMLLGILLTISAILYWMLDLALDPLDELRASTALNREQLIQQRITLLGLDKPWYERYVNWLTHFVQGDFGLAWHTNTRVIEKLGPAMWTSVQLVFASTILAIILGVTIGVVSALRQYTGFDYFITVLSFLLYSLPVFWVSVLLKQFLAIGMNDYLANPAPQWAAIALAAVLSAVFWTAALGGRTKRRLIVFGISLVASFGLFAYILGSGFLTQPSIGILGVAVMGFAAAVVFTAGLAGIRNRRALYAALTTAAVGTVMYYVCQWIFFYVPGSDWLLVALFASALGAAALIGYLFGGPDRQVSMRVAMLVALVTAIATFADKVMQQWTAYMQNPMINSRPVATIGQVTPSLNPDYWMAHLDKFTHLLLPTIALVLISFASYTRYQRGSMLEVMNQDYIRTARAKGLSERVVIVRHALRNALLPLASMVPVELITMVGGAILTETIFGWAGMGKFFNDSLQGNEMDPTMAYVVIIGALAMFANIVADLMYAVLDPRIRVNA